jgi:putative restriction endonuclease
MRARIARYRRVDSGDRSDFEIGCRILTQRFFLAERDWIPVPTNWSPNIVSFETYNTG